MINLIAGCTDNKFVQVIGILCAFFGTFLALKYLSSMLPKDAGKNLHMMERNQLENQEGQDLYLSWLLV